MKTTIILADDHQLVGASIAALLRHEPDFEVLAACVNGREATELAQRLRPNVAIIDVAMPEMNGIEAIRCIKGVSPETRVVIISSYTDEAYVRGALTAGAVGYVVKSGEARDLIKAIREGARGKPFLSPEVSAIARRIQASRIPQAGQHGVEMLPLSPREREVLQHVVEGKTAKEIAATLGIRVSTVKDHRKHIKEKLEIYDTPGLTCYAIRVGIIRADTGKIESEA
jgi:DNA-binding NarL/FixJ family response regulator